MCSPTSPSPTSPTTRSRRRNWRASTTRSVMCRPVSPSTWPIRPVRWRIRPPDGRSSAPGSRIYGVSPGKGVDQFAQQLQPVMALKARISYVKQARAGSRISYGRRYQFASDSTVATIPLGYADGVPRRLSSTTERPGGHVLIRGRRCPIVGTITMDQFMVDCGDLEVRAGEEVVLIGNAGGPARRRADHAPSTGPSNSARSATRSCAVSASACRACTSSARNIDDDVAPALVGAR